MGDNKNIRGIERNQEIDAKSLWRPVKTYKQRFSEMMEKPESLIYGIGLIVSIMVFFPALGEVAFLVGLLLLNYVKKQKFILPYRLPKKSEMPDYNDLKPNGKPGKAAGISFFGNEKVSKKELWFNDSDMRTHILVLGTTGAGKTEALLGLAYNAFVQGSGLIFVDGKGTNVLYSQIFSMARSAGREDDLLVINYMTGNRDVFGPQTSKMSNTLNPFSSGSASSLTQLLVSLMDDSGGEGGMWKGRAVSLISAIMMSLTFMRDKKEILLDVDVIREYLLLDNIIKLYKTRRDLPKNAREALRAYLTSLPGFQENAPKQTDTAVEQHGYLQMQFTRLLGSLSDEYGYIFRTNLGEVDFWDVVANRRILVVLLPALEKADDELRNLGKIIVGCLKMMMSAGLGSNVEGEYKDIIEANPTKAPSPFMCILDEYGYYAVKGAAVMPAQARGLGFCMVFAGQDLPSFEKASKEEAASTIANCNIKIFMKVDDPKDTYELFEKSVGEAYVTQVSGFQANPGGLLTQYTGMQNANVELRKRGSFLDLKDQEPGEAHIIFRSILVRANMFYANPPPPKTIRLNHFLRVEPPDLKDIQILDAGLSELRELVINEKHLNETNATFKNEEDEITKLFNLIETASVKLPPQESACWAIASLCMEMKLILDDNLKIMDEMANVPISSDSQRKINIFSDGSIEDDESENFKPKNLQNKTDKYRNNESNNKNDNNEDEDEEEEDDEDGDNKDDDDDDINVFLNEKVTRNNFSSIEKAAGASDEEANSSSEKAVEDMKLLSEYPNSGGPEEKEPEEIMDILRELDDGFKVPDED